MTTYNLAYSILDEDELGLARVNQDLETLSARERVCWAGENLPGEPVVSSSFGIQSAVMLHLMNSIKPGIPVILAERGEIKSFTGIDSPYETPEAAEVHIDAEALSVAESINQLLDYLHQSGVLKAGYQPVAVSA